MSRTGPFPTADFERALDSTGGVACLSCRPKLLEAARALYARVQHPTAAEIQAVLDDNGCLCTTYRPVLEAMRLTSRWRTGGG